MKPYYLVAIYCIKQLLKKALLNPKDFPCTYIWQGKPRSKNHITMCINCIIIPLLSTKRHTFRLFTAAYTLKARSINWQGYEANVMMRSGEIKREKSSEMGVKYRQDSSWCYIDGNLSFSIPSICILNHLLVPVAFWDCMSTCALSAIFRIR